MRNMKKIVKNFMAFAFALGVLAAFSCESCAADPAPVSRDADLDAGKWVELSMRYANPHASNGVSNDLNLPFGQDERVEPYSLANWWSSFEDDTLTRLIEWALMNNRDLRSARSKVRESRASLGISESAVLPWLDSANSWTKSDTSENSTSAGKRLEISHLGIDASWEIDVFGGRHQEIAAGIATLEADYSALHAAWVSLSSEVALNYLSLRTLQERLAVAEQNLALQMETIDLLQSRYDAGLVDALALSQAQYTAAQTKAAIPPIKAGIETSMNGLAILTGSIPGSLEETLGSRAPLNRLKTAKLIGIPADSIRQRPDIRTAERRLAAQLARKKSAEADLLPRFYLTGSIGLESLWGGSLFSSDSFGSSFGPRITLPIFHGRAIRNNIRVQGERAEQLLAAYEGAVLNAAAEVRDAISAGALEIERNESLRLGADAARTALFVAQDKYKNGLTDFSNVITSQQALLALEEAVAISDGQMMSNAVRIYKAIGGGWAPIEAENPEEARLTLQ